MDSTIDSSSDEVLVEDAICDAILKVGDVLLPVHRVIMCKCSRFFSSLFLRWSDSEQKVYEINGVSSEMMQLIIDFVNTGSVTLTDDNIQELIIAADRFNVMALTQKCCNFMEDQLCPKNCIGKWKLTNNILLPEFQKHVFRFICQHFEEVVQHKEFLQLELQELADILGRDELVSQESTVYECIMKWIKHRPKKRQGTIATLMSKVRIGLLDSEFMTCNVWTNDLISSNPACQTMLHNAAMVASQNMSSESEPGFYFDLIRPRLPNDILLVTGGWTADMATDAVESFDYCTKSWFRSPLYKLKRPLAYHGTAYLDGYVYVLGGRSLREYYSSVHRFNLITKTWKEVSSLHHQRCYLSVTVLNHHIYAIGGSNGQTRFRTAEYYQPHTNQWTLVASMNERRSDANCTTLNNKIYICGGYNGTTCLQTAEYYDPDYDQWTLIAPMSERHSGLGVISYNGHIFAVGGYDHNTYLSSVEAYNTITNTWHNVAELSAPRTHFGIAVVDRQLFIIGGYNNTLTTKVERYNPSTNSWSHVGNIDIPRRGVSCVLIGFQHIDEYCAPRHHIPLETLFSQLSERVL